MASTEFKRQTAKIVRVQDITNGQYVKTANEMEPNYILTPQNMHVSRVNIIGVVLDKQMGETSSVITFDDGSGQISIRLFEKDAYVEQLVIGDVVLVIGRPREYNGEKYLVYEIIKKISNPKWIEYRKLELEHLNKNAVEQSPVNDTQMQTQTASSQVFQQPSNQSTIDSMQTPQVKEEVIGESQPSAPQESHVSSNQSVVEEPVVEHVAQEQVSETVEQVVEEPQTTPVQTEEKQPEVVTPFSKIMNCIKLLDQADGAGVEEVIEMSGIENADTVIKKLIEEGEIFEIKPGRVKILE